jgi:hypothetical protein
MMMRRRRMMDDEDDDDDDGRYQGEQDVYEPALYECLFPAMVRDWRAKFKNANGGDDKPFHFGFVSLAGWVARD